MESIHRQDGRGTDGRDGTMEHLRLQDRSERLAKIRANRGTPEREALIKAMAQAKTAQAKRAAADAAADRAWERRFNRADLRTQAMMLAEELNDPGLTALLRDLATMMPAG